MSATPTTFAILQQLDATLRLVGTLSPSLSTYELVAARHALLQAYTAIGQVVVSRNLETEGIALIGMSLQSSF